MKISRRALKAVSYAMAIKDIRYYLCGVLIETNGQETRLIATDGHRLHAVIENTQESLSDVISFIMPADMVKKCLAVKTRDKDAEIYLSFDGVKITAKLPDGSEIAYGAIDGKFPDYHRIIPREPFESKLSCFNPEYVADAINAYAGYLELKNPGVGFNWQGNSCGFLSFNGFTAIVMPMRGDICESPDFRLVMPLQGIENIKAAA